MEETIINHVKASLDAAEYGFSKITKEIIKNYLGNQNK